MTDTRSYSPETKRQLWDAAKESGVEIRVLDIALRRFSMRLAAAVHGSGAAELALAGMGIDLNDTDGAFRGNEPILLDVAEALREKGGVVGLSLAILFDHSESDVMRKLLPKLTRQD